MAEPQFAIFSQKYIITVKRIIINCIRLCIDTLVLYLNQNRCDSIEIKLVIDLILTLIRFEVNSPM